MMPELNQIYDAAFFEEWGVGHARYIESAETITNVLFDAFKPRRLVDLGSGCGVYSHFFRKKGAEVLSIDGVRPPAENSFPGPVEIRDITVPINNEWGAFDLTLCLEVAEHIPEMFIEPFLDNLTRFSDRVLLSAAPPNQGGHHHVNEQPKRYWVRRLADKGFLYRRKETGQLMESFKLNKPGYMWMSEHISLYEKTSRPDWNRAGLPFSTDKIMRSQK